MMAILPLLLAAAPEVPEVWICHFDTARLVTDELEWSFVREHLDGIKLYIGKVGPGRQAWDPDALAAFCAVCAEAGIRLSIECGGTLDFMPLDETNGEKSAELELRSFRNLREHGGELFALDLDGPVRRLMHPGEGRQGFGDLEAALTELCDYLTIVRAEFPETAFYALTNFPNWGWRGGLSYHGRGEMRQDWGDYAPVLAGIIRRTREAGVPVAGVTCDNPWEYANGTRRSATLEDPAQVDWMHRILDLERYVEAEGLEFNLIVNSEMGGNTSAQAFYEGTLAFLEAYRAAGGTPKRILIQSWYPHPEAVGPEDEEYSFTNLVAEVIRRVKGVE